MLIMTAATLSLHAQIYSNTADASKAIKYDSEDGNDRLFVFYQSHGSYKPGSLSVESTDGLADFDWKKYDPSTDDFSIPVSFDPNLSVSTISGLDEGGYQVEILIGGIPDTTFVAWVMLDNFVVGTDKTDDGFLKNNMSGCPDDRYLYLLGFVELDSFFYYDPVTHDPIRFKNGYTLEWTSDNSEIEIYNATRYLYLENQVVPEPVEDTYFILTATDSLGMTEVDSVLYDTKFTRAEFTMEYYDKINQVYDPDLTESWDSKMKTGSLDAPLTVKFLNESKNGAKFTWVFLDTFNIIQNEGTKISLDTTDLDYEPEFTYLSADEYYYPYLVSVSDMGCPDTFKLDDGIRVVPSQLEIPNVFSPNGDDANPVWVFKHQSLKECRITVINKFGRVVYRQKIDDLYQWTGWEGNILNTERPAPEGPYYYIVEALGYDNVEYKDPSVFERWKIERQQGGIGNTGQTGQGAGDEPSTQTGTVYTGWLYLYRYTGTL